MVTNANKNNSRINRRVNSFTKSITSLCTVFALLILTSGCLSSRNCCQCRGCARTNTCAWKYVQHNRNQRRTAQKNAIAENVVRTAHQVDESEVAEMETTEAIKDPRIGIDEFKTVENQPEVDNNDKQLASVLAPTSEMQAITPIEESSTRRKITEAKSNDAKAPTMNIPFKFDRVARNETTTPERVEERPSNLTPLETKLPENTPNTIPTKEPIKSILANDSEFQITPLQKLTAETHTSQPTEQPVQIQPPVEQPPVEAPTEIVSVPRVIEAPAPIVDFNHSMNFFNIFVLEPEEPEVITLHALALPEHETLPPIAEFRSLPPTSLQQFAQPEKTKNDSKQATENRHGNWR